MTKIIKKGLKKILSEKRYYKIKEQLRKTVWTFNKPKFPVLEDNRKLIHLGCGKIFHPDFINVDICFHPHVHYLSNIEKLPMFENNFADLIYASHCLEHISHPSVILVLKEWFRVLKSGGILRVSVPDFDSIVEIYQKNGNDLTMLQGVLMGEHSTREYQHGVVFNEKTLKRLLVEVGFKMVRKWEYGVSAYKSFPDWSGKELEVNGKSYSISLNIEAIK